VGPSSKKRQEEYSSSEEEEAAEELTSDDIKKIRALIKDQDAQIEELKESVKQYKEKLVYQLAENDNTVKRYKREIDSTKDFAISKFAKDLLEVRDNLQLALDHLDLEKINAIESVEELKKEFEQVAVGMKMTSQVMDKVLQRFGVEQFDPIGEKFDPNIHEAVFMIPKSEHPNNHVGEVMQTGWKIGDRVLRAPKVGIVKK